jgi:DNA-binding transcriptional LysR family regulator
VTDELVSGRLARALTEWTLPFPGVCLYYPRQRLPSAGLAAFIEHFKASRRAA